MEGRHKNYVSGVSPELRQAASQLRAQMTTAEQVLWEALRDKKLGGLRFRAQHPVGQFILDFYCPACKMAVELDGSIHDNRAEEDAARTAQLRAYGYRVLRNCIETIQETPQPPIMGEQYGAKGIWFPHYWGLGGG